MDTHTCQYSRYSGEGNAIVIATRNVVRVTSSSDFFSSSPPLLLLLSSWSSGRDGDCLLRFLILLLLRHDNGFRLDIAVRSRGLLSGWWCRCCCCWRRRGSMLPSSATVDECITSLDTDRGWEKEKTWNFRPEMGFFFSFHNEREKRRKGKRKRKEI